ncbi:O-antigen ligase family protein [Aliiroseovarius crassostreae]|uniref:O-antigen ligase family protein n=1 Tax=Aliiroseovarius crassostreae TaxID=154981 RepID=UPI003C7D2FA3
MKVRKLTLQKDTITAVMLALFLGSSGLKWIPLLSIGPIRVEIHNALALALIAYLGYQLATRRRYVIPTFFWCVAALTIWLSAGLAIHGTINLSPIILTLPVALASLVLCNFTPAVLDRLVLIALLAQTIIVIGFIGSAYVGGIDLWGGIQTYFLSQNRLGFLLGTVRPILNAFSTGPQAGLPEYDSWLLNHLSATFFITFCLAVAARPTTFLQRAGLGCSAFISLFFLIVLFSSSTVLALILALVAPIVRGLISPMSRLSFWGILAALLLALALLAPPLFQYFLLNLESDIGSASTRLDQYTGALEGIFENPLFGVGLRTFQDHTVHNLFLASFMMTGIVGGVLAATLFVIAIGICAEGMRGLLRRSPRPDLCLLMAMLPLIFITRSGLAGGFGLPSNAELFAVATAYLARRHHRQIRSAQQMQEIQPLQFNATKRAGHAT